MKFECLVVTIVVWTSDIRDIVTEPGIAQVYRVIRSGCVSQILLQVVANYLHRTSDPPRMFTIGV